jgi:hypothetical protein
LVQKAISANFGEGSGEVGGELRKRHEEQNFFQRLMTLSIWLRIIHCLELITTSSVTEVFGHWGLL